MKIKVQPEDFIVEELLDIPIKRTGKYTLLKLTKQYWNTLDAIDFIVRQMKLQKDFFSRAGLKDRYSLSIQYLSYNGSLFKPFFSKNLSLEPVGKIDNPLRPHHLRGNSFKITIRDLDQLSIKAIKQNIVEIRQCGIPNYFDDQRFGSARHKQGFIAKLLIKGHYQGALKLFLCSPYTEDSKAVKLFKKVCQENWGSWNKCYEFAPRKYRSLLISLIKNPRDYKSAFKRIDRELLNLFLLAYQSYLFNETLSAMIKNQCPDPRSIEYGLGRMLFCTTPARIGQLSETKIPLVNHKTSLDNIVGDYIKKILIKEGIEQKGFALRKLRFRGVQFKTFLRPAIVSVDELYHNQAEADDKYPGRFKLGIQFILPPGSYATLVLKRIMFKLLTD